MDCFFSGRELEGSLQVISFCVPSHYIMLEIYCIVCELKKQT